MRIVKSAAVDSGSVHVPRATLNDDISLEATGLLCRMLSCPDDQRFTVPELLKSNNVGRDKLYKLLKELEESGYVKRLPSRDKGQFSGLEIFVYPSSQK